MKNWGIGLLMLAVGLAACSGKSAEEAPAEKVEAEKEAAPKTVRVTAIPDENPTELARKHELLSAYLEEKLGAPVTFIPVTDYGAAVQALRSGKAEFAWLGGFTFVQARVLASARPLAMRGIDQKFQSAFIAHADSGVTKPEDLKGKTFAFGSKSSTSGHLMPRHFLASEWGIDVEKDFAGAPIFSGAHDATVKAVESGKVQAGALNIMVWEKMTAKKEYDPAKVSLAWKSPEFVDYVWAAGEHVSDELAQKFTQAFVELDGKNADDKALLDLQRAERYIPAENAMFDAIEKVARSTGLLK